jgi:PPOX class probable FMN-dependent enzyme
MRRAVQTPEELEALYGEPAEASLIKETSRITPHYRRMIEASPFAILATAGEEGLDCSPRGDKPGFVRIADETTLLLPDRRGNNRIDSLRNVIRDPRIALLFLIPGEGNTLRVNGRAIVSAEAELLASFTVDGKAPRSVLVVSVERAYFQCARAILRSELWNPERHAARGVVPSAGEILADLSEARVGGESYDKVWPERAKTSLW